MLRVGSAAGEDENEGEQERTDGREREAVSGSRPGDGRAESNWTKEEATSARMVVDGVYRAVGGATSDRGLALAASMSMSSEGSRTQTRD